MECQEPKCTREATKEWKGSMICNDHFDEYKLKWERIYMECDD